MPPPDHSPGDSQQFLFKVSREFRASCQVNLAAVCWHEQSETSTDAQSRLDYWEIDALTDQ